MRLLKENIGGITMCIFELLVGILLLINPVNFTSGIIIALGVLLLPIGIIEIMVYFRLEPLEAAKRQSLTKGLVVILAGLFCIFKIIFLGLFLFFYFCFVVNNVFVVFFFFP